MERTSPTPWLTRGDPSIVHLGHSALILADGRRHLVITSEDFGLAPGGIQLLPVDLRRLRGELAAGRTSLAHWRPRVVELVDLRVRAIDADPTALAVLSDALHAEHRVGAFDPGRQRSTAASLVASAVAGERPDGDLLRLIGAGPGSTPAGDDVVVGVLAGLRASGRADAAAAIERGLPALLDRTTSASRHYLSAAAEGRFAERVHMLVRGLRNRDSALAAARAASQWGATSGLDLLSGIVTAAAPSARMRRTA